MRGAYGVFSSEAEGAHARKASGPALRNQNFLAENTCYYSRKEKETVYKATYSRVHEALRGSGNCHFRMEAQREQNF